MNLWERFEHIDPRVIYVLLIIAVSIPIMKPIGLPISISYTTRLTYDAVEKLPAGSRVLMSLDYSPGGMPELHPQVTALMFHFIKRNLQVVTVGASAEGANFADALLALTFGAAGKKYGTDYINLGFFPGDESGLTALAEDIRKVYKADYTRKPVDSFPMMASIKNIKDFGLAFTFNTGGKLDTHGWIRQVYTAHKVPVVLGVGTNMAPTNTAYVQSKQAAGMLVGLRGAAEYELLVGKPGSAVAAMDSQSAAHMVVVIIILLGNIGYFVSRGKGKPGQSGAAGGVRA
jgi:hypothetical protein